MRILILDTLSISSLPVIIFFRILNFKILFISIENYFRSNKLLKILSTFNIKWFSYQNYSFDHVKTEQKIKVAEFSRNLSNDISNKFYNDELTKIFENKLYFSACLGRSIHREVQKIIEIMTIAKSLEKMGKKIYLWIPNNLITKRVNNKFYNFNNLNLFPNFYISIYFFILSRFIKNFFRLFISKASNATIKAKNYELYDKFQVACYPHKGIFYGDLYSKDYFYSNEEKNPFFYKKIVHIEWDDKNLPTKSKNYYNKKEINFLFWKDLSDNKKILKKTLFFWFNSKILFLKLLLYDSQIFYFILLSIFHILKSSENLAKLKNLKILLVCHDELFPIEISIACKKYKVSTIALQDRLSLAAVSPLFIFDFYFVIGEKSKSIIEKIMPHPLIKNLKNLYLVKTDKYYENKYIDNEFKNYKFRCIVMDYPSNPDWYVNGRSMDNSWRINRDFYNIIINLANKYPQVKFLIKSKSYKWVHIPFFNKIIDEINKKENISILHDQKKWTPLECLKVGDFAIARPTSLVEEMLSIRKPVIIYNNFGAFPEKIFYENFILTDSYNEIVDKFNLIINDYDKFNSSLDQNRNQLFYKRESGKLDKEINKIFLSKI